jgi:hypothetical protein
VCITSDIATFTRAERAVGARCIWPQWRAVVLESAALYYNHRGCSTASCSRRIRGRRAQGRRIQPGPPCARGVLAGGGVVAVVAGRFWFWLWFLVLFPIAIADSARVG